MAQKSNPISLRLGHNRKSDFSWFADFNYTKITDRAFGIQMYLNALIKQGKKKGYRSRGLSKDRTILHILPLKFRMFPFLFSAKKKKKRNPSFNVRKKKKR